MVEMVIYVLDKVENVVEKEKMVVSSNFLFSLWSQQPSTSSL